MVHLTKSVRTMAVFTIHFFLAPVFYRPSTAPARLDPFCPQCQFILFVERLQLSCHENAPVSRIVSASCISDLLLYSSIGTYCKCRCKSWDGLMLTFDPTFFKRDNLKNGHVRVKCSCTVVFSFFHFIVFMKLVRTLFQELHKPTDFTTTV